MSHSDQCLVKGGRFSSPSEIYQALQGGTSISSLRVKRVDQNIERVNSAKPYYLRDESAFGRIDRETGGGGRHLPWRVITLMWVGFIVWPLRFVT